VPHRRHNRGIWSAASEPDEDFSYSMEFASMADFAATACEVGRHDLVVAHNGLS
jgi:hypothetical protein